jgi:hypothetical protein
MIQRLFASLRFCFGLWVSQLHMQVLISSSILVLSFVSIWRPLNQQLSQPLNQPLSRSLSQPLHEIEWAMWEIEPLRDFWDFEKDFERTLREIFETFERNFRDWAIQRFLRGHDRVEPWKCWPLWDWELRVRSWEFRVKSWKLRHYESCELILVGIESWAMWEWELGHLRYWVVKVERWAMWE